MRFGVVKTRGSKPFYFNKYNDAIDFGFNIPNLFGLYFWIGWKMSAEETR